MKKEFLKKIILPFVMILLTLQLSAQLPGRYSHNENKIIISGESNIQDFMVHYYFNKKLKGSVSESADCSSSQKGVIQIPVQKLVFSNKHMKNDFLNLVHAKRYPLIKLFYNPELIDQFGANKQKNVPITIQITNVKKAYLVPVSLLIKRKNYTKLKGQVHIKLSDFKLKPKRYFFGLIRLKDSLKINFILYFYPKVT
jgi:hypothetical protein